MADVKSTNVRRVFRHKRVACLWCLTSFALRACSLQAPCDDRPLAAAVTPAFAEHTTQSTAELCLCCF